MLVRTFVPSVFKVKVDIKTPFEEIYHNIFLSLRKEMPNNNEILHIVHTSLDATHEAFLGPMKQLIEDED